MTDLVLIAFTVAVFVLAGAVKGVIGLGLPTIAIGLLGAAMLPGVAAALLIAPSLVTNVSQIGYGAGSGRRSSAAGSSSACSSSARSEDQSARSAAQTRSICPSVISG